MDALDPNGDLRLDEKRLGAELGVSRTPVREALEGMAARLMCERATDEQLGSLRTLFSPFEQDDRTRQLD